MKLTCAAHLLLAAASLTFNQSPPFQKTTQNLNNAVRTSSDSSAHKTSNTFLLESPLKLMEVLQQHKAEPVAWE